MSLNLVLYVQDCTPIKDQLLPWDHYDSGPAAADIVEISCVLIDTNTNTIKDEQFHAYVKPSKGVTIDSTFTEITAIKQWYLENAETFPKVTKTFDQWEINVGLSDSCEIYSLCSEKTTKLIKDQCIASSVDPPAWLHNIKDLRIAFGKAFDVAAEKMTLQGFNTKIKTIQFQY